MSHQFISKKNYRCGQEIIRVASHMKQGNAEVIGDRDGGHVTVTCRPQGFADQCAHAAQRVHDQTQHGTPLHEFVVICPTNEQCETAANILRKRGIPAFFRNTDHYRVTLVTAFIEGCAAWATLGRECSNYRLGTLLLQWRSILGQRWERESDVALTQILISLTDRENEPATQLMQELRDIGLTTALTRTPLVDDAIEVAKMTHALTVGALRDLSVRDLAERARKTDRVEITTMTSSKGLEFDIVTILGLDQKRVPFFSSIDNPEALKEERRKFYVSITRARNEVHLYYSGFVEWKKSIGRSGPSMFLKEIGVI